MKAKLRILNLEDSSNDAELNAAMISARWPQAEVVRVGTREGFLAALQRESFDLILSDYTMPGFDGRLALSMARERRPEVPFIFVSGTIGEDAAIEALKNGATDYVLKHRLMRLIPAVDRALREVEERAETRRAEEAMRQSEHKYRQLFECLGEAAFLIDKDSGKIIDANHRAESVLGCARNDIIGRNESHFLSADATQPNGGPIVQQNLHCANGAGVPVAVLDTNLKLYNRSLVLRLCHELNQ